jgi:two-component system LytT family sensor kinase
MSARIMPRRLLRSFALWTAVGLFFGSQAVLYSVYLPSQPWQQPLLRAMTDWYIWGMLSVAIVALAERLPLTRAQRVRSVILLVLAGVGITAAKIAIRYSLGLVVPALSFGPYTLPQMLMAQFHLNFAMFCAIFGIAAAFQYHRKYRDRELRASQLESVLTQAQLQVLRSQLQPHFLFNTLHTISALMQEGEIEAADRMIARLSELLRLVTDSAHTQEVTVRAELELLRRYLEIQQIRFQDTLRVRMNIADDTLDALLPSFMLQPLAENAIRHGISRRAAGGELSVTTRRDDGKLIVEIADNGVGLDASQGSALAPGVGLANTRARLDQLYGANHRFEVREREGGGVVVTIAVPYATTEVAVTPSQ